MKSSRRYCFVFLLLLSGIAQASIVVPGSPVVITFPRQQATFFLKNSGDDIKVVQLDLAERFDVNAKSNDGLAVVYPRTIRLVPGEKQKFNVIWRGDQDQSRYYYIRVTSVGESKLTEDRSNEDNNKPLRVKVGQAFPLNIIAPDAKVVLRLVKGEEGVWLQNKGKGGDYVESIRMQDGRTAKINGLLGPGAQIYLDGILPDWRIKAVKLRRFGWVDVSG